jgi:hypothetical protein
MRYRAAVQIALYDTGVGGLTTLLQCLPVAPAARWIYVADEAVFPAGRRPAPELRDRLRVVSSLLSSRNVDVLLPVASVCWPHLDALQVPGATTVDPVPTLARAIAAGSGVAALLAPSTVLDSDVPHRLFCEARFVSACSSRIDGVVEDGGYALAPVVADAVGALSDERVARLVVIDSHAQFATGLIRPMCPGVDALDVARLLSDALEAVVDQRAFCSVDPAIEIWVPDEHRARVAQAAYERLGANTLQFKTFGAHASPSSAASATADLALLAYAALDRGSIDELRHFTTAGATSATGGEPVDVLLSLSPGRGWRYEIESVLTAGDIVGVSGVKRHRNGLERHFAHRLTFRGGRIAQLVEVY